MIDPDLGWAQVRRKTFLQTNDLFVWETGDRAGRDAGWVFAGFGWWYISYCRTGLLDFNWLPGRGQLGEGLPGMILAGFRIIHTSLEAKILWW